MSQNESQPAPRPSRLKKFMKKFMLGVLIVGLVCSAVVSVSLAFYISRISQDLPSDDEILSYEANQASIVYDRKGQVISELYVENRKPIKLGDLSKWMVMSILAAEDSDFYSHAGIRPLAILRSLITGDRGHGASTITQQLARNLFLTSEKSIERKAKEALISFRLEKLYSKDTLLETYLNAIYFGHGAWGIDSAAHSYFDKSASQLTLNEASILAGLVAAPEKYSPLRHLDLARNRQNYVLSRMVRLGWISEEEAKAAAAEELKFNARAVENKLSFNKAPYFVSHILFKELIPQFGSEQVYKSGMKIYTTLDSDLQKAAEDAMAKLKSEGGLVALDPVDGAVLALVGGKDFEGTKFNRVTQAYRQPGSAFKPIVYTAAIEAGYRPVDHIMDSPITIQVPNSPVPEWSPTNYDETFSGEETLLTALARSHNTPAVRLTYMLGPQKVVEMARRLGITSPYVSPVLSIGLGSTSVTPLELAVVFSALANGGKRLTPYFVREIRSKDNKVLFTAAPQPESAIAPETALVVRSMLQEVIRAGTGSRGRIAGYEMFGKTGTSNDFTNAWFAGAVPGIAAIVYAGNDDLKPLGHKGATGSAIALPIWSAFMKQAVEIMNTPKTFPAVPARVTPVRVCVESGYLAGIGCKRSTTVYLPEGRVPASTCPVHGEGTGDETNAPQLLLLEQDREALEAQAPLEEVPPEQTQTQQPPEVTPEPQQPEKPSARPSKKQQKSAPAPAPDTQSKSWRDLIKKDDRPIDERYQELLKKYNIQ